MRVDVAKLKENAAREAVQFVESGMIVGLGHGSTTIYALRFLKEMIEEGELDDILCIPCSLQVEKDAHELGLPLTTLNEHQVIDLTIDGADEATPEMELIKGGGGALLREKIVAQASEREIIIVDQTKMSPRLGVQWPVPIEVEPFGWRSQASYLESLGAEIAIRENDDGMEFKTDQGNKLLDCNFGPIDDPEALAVRLKERAGIVEHGLFLGLATDLIIAYEDGIEHLTK